MSDYLNHDNPDTFWVHPDAPDVGCTGAYDSPFGSLEAALDRVKPGQTIVLMPGVYVGDCNIQISGTARNPIRILAEQHEKVIISSACWFLYDTSDLIISGMQFQNAIFGAVSLIGACSRNRFENISFLNCGNRGETSCTFYMGGAGGGCNIIEGCSFLREKGALSPSKSAKATSVALLLAQGDTEHGDPIINNLIRKNTFAGYDYGIIIGSDESRSVRCGHLIEYNTISGCTHDSLLFKSGDTTARGNIITDGAGTAITVQSELECTIEDNRMVKMHSGIILQGSGHTVSNNCIAECNDSGIWLRAVSAVPVSAAANIFIEQNTLVNCTSSHLEGQTPICGVLIDAGTSGVIQKNLFYGAGKPYTIISSGDAAADKKVTQFVMSDNGAAGDCAELEGITKVSVEFNDRSTLDFTNTSGSGASGWVLTPAGFDPSLDENSTGVDYRDAEIFSDDEGNLLIPGEDSRGDLFGSLYSEELGEEEGEEEEKSDRDNRSWFDRDGDS